METNEAIVYILDDDEAVRRSLCRLIESAGLATLAFEAPEDFLKVYHSGMHGCLLVDLRMPKMTGLELLDALRARGSTMPAIMITAFGDVPQAVRALKAGALDFIQKPFNGEVLLERIREALERDHQIRMTTSKQEEVWQRVERLTPREKQVMHLLVRGFSSKEVGTELGISRKTVDIHRGRIMHKLEAGSVAQLVRMIMSIETAPA
jgi:RNA polymerase sigma factor (sigma-70 family)